MSTPSSPVPAGSGPDPSRRPTDAERQLVIDRIQQAMAEDHLAFEELDDRFGAVYAAATMGELERATADLPVLHQPPPPSTARHLAPASNVSLIGDAEVGGWIAVGDDLTVATLIGDATVDLSSAAIGPDGVTVSARSIIGDVKVIVPDGARVQVDASTLIGDKRQGLSTPIEGGPVVRVKAFSAIGDVRVYSLSLVPEGKLRKLWGALRNR